MTTHESQHEGPDLKRHRSSREVEVKADYQCYVGGAATLKTNGQQDTRERGSWRRSFVKIEIETLPYMQIEKDEEKNKVTISIEGDDSCRALLVLLEEVCAQGKQEFLPQP